MRRHLQARQSDCTVRDAMITAALMAIGGVLVNALVCGVFPREERFGAFSGICGIVFTALLLGYWWRVQRLQGLQGRPRVSFREIYVLYFGLSIEVGLIVNVFKLQDVAHEFVGHSECAMFGLGAMLLPPALIFAIALIDDLPATAHKRYLKRKHRRAE